MAGIVNQRDIELVFEDLISSEIEKMSEEEREDARKFHLDEAARFSAEEYESEDEDEDEEVPRHPMEPDADGLIECIADLIEENAEITEKNSLQREMNALMKVRNTLTEEEKCLREEMLGAEKEWGRLLREESSKTGGPSDLIKELESEVERLWSEVQRLEGEAEMTKETSRTPWWRRWFLWWL